VLSATNLTEPAATFTEVAYQLRSLGTDGL